VLIFRVLTGVAIGTICATIYSSLVALVHFAVRGRWDDVHRTAVGFISVGALLGLLGGIASAWCERPPAPANRTPRIARQTMKAIPAESLPW
jgi:MFS family permease